jgi:hypothetical protein
MKITEESSGSIGNDGRRRESGQAFLSSHQDLRRFLWMREPTFVIQMSTEMLEVNHTKCASENRKHFLFLGKRSRIKASDRNLH